MNSISTLTRFIFLSALLLLPAAVSTTTLPDFRSIVQQSSPAVVKIIVKQQAAPARQGHALPEDMPEYLRRFFEFRGGPQGRRPQMGMGSGFVISDDGAVPPRDMPTQNY